jgi:acyl transferase domain-containing protein
MREYGPSYEQQLLPVIRSVDPQVAFYSSVTGKRLTGNGSLEASYWRANMENPVLFNSALRSALQDETDSKVVMIEIGPHPALAGPIGQILRDIGRSDHVHVGTLSRGKGCQESLLHLAGKLYQQSVPLDYSVVCPPGKFVRDLPRYNWKQETSYWSEPRVTRDWRFREHPPHDLLGSRLVDQASEPCWRKVLALEDALWLTGHEVNSKTVFPAAGYIAMVGEALRQLSGESTYSVKNVRIASARILEASNPTEIITSLKPMSADSSDSSPWYEFAITSFDGTRWVRNCFGEAMASTDKTFSLSSAPTDIAPFPRAVDEKNWYSILRKVGFNYTGLFEGLACISAATTSNEAKASVTAQVQGATDGGKCSTYALHPAVIDQCFQLFTVASCNGLGRNTNQLAVPTFIEQMVISPSTLDLDVLAKVTSMAGRGSWTGDLEALSAGLPVMRLKGMKTSVLTGSDSADEEVPLITQLELMPHSDFVPFESSLHQKEPRLKEWPLMEELVLLCSFDHLEQVKLDNATAQHLVKFHNWMRLYTERFQSGSNFLVSKELRLQDLNHDQRLARIEQIVAELSSLLDPAFSTSIHRLFKHAADIFAGLTHPLHVLMEDNILSEFYNAISFDSADAIRLIGNTNPHLRILEVGAGTGGTTARVLEALTSPYGERMYSRYSYTDVSAGFMAAAKERFAGFENIDFAVLDASKDPKAQGFQLESYDLIIAANVCYFRDSILFCFFRFG